MLRNEMGVCHKKMNMGIFLDRDGVLNKLVLNPATGEFGAPLAEKDLKFFPWTLRVVKKFKQMGYLLLLVSNQPDYAKGYTNLKNIKSVQSRVKRYFTGAGIRFSGYFYCLHHPQARVSSYRLNCDCRKPKPYFLLKAKEKYALDMKNSWLVGDCDSDILCGKRASLNTILIDNKHSRHKRGASSPDFMAPDLRGALKIISTKRGLKI
jgi:D-glycero-D-manno-heptose 1,7-bisphosphate phosphatase